MLIASAPSLNGGRKLLPKVKNKIMVNRNIIKVIPKAVLLVFKTFFKPIA